MKFKEPSLYEIISEVKLTKLIEARGKPKWDDVKSISSSDMDFILHGEGWYTRFRELGKKSTGKLLRCMSLYDIILLLGAISAIIGAIVGIISLFK